jgi:heterodisulfide reductase subunit C
LVAFSWAIRQFQRIRRNILFGKEEVLVRNDSRRWRNLVLVAFGQKKMFKRLLPAVMHFFIYAAFLLTQIELIEIFIDGFFGVHRFFAAYLGGFYTFVISVIEVLSVLALIGTVVFLARRNLLKLPRFNGPEMTLWPVLDANLILLGEIALITGIFLMNGSDIVLQQIDPEHYTDTGTFLLSGYLGPLLFGGLPLDALVFLERTGWWLHILTVFAFLNYLPSSKHLHIALAFPNVWYSRLTPRGKIENMPAVEHEVRSMMGLPTTTTESQNGGEIPEFGARDIFDLSWKTIMDAYSCTECGRCTAVCPANITGKKLSPRKVMMDIRDRTEEVATKIDSGALQYVSADKRHAESHPSQTNFDDGKSLFDYITPEELHACTTCAACIEACPVMIDPLTPILEMRRHEILTQGSGAPDWLAMFNSLENTGSVWQMSAERQAWTKES